MKSILVFGAGKSSSYLIEYLVENASKYQWHVTIVDKYIDHVVKRYSDNPNISTSTIDIAIPQNRTTLVAPADIVISLLPPDLHIIIANACLLHGKHLITASYVSDAIKALDEAAKEKGIMMMCEMGLDPGIDHMSAMQIIDGLEAKGATITSFKSHCGGLVAPECDTNPWHYKISWNPRNVVLAGQAGAHFLLKNEEIHVVYKDMFRNSPSIHVGELPPLAYYPNRDSLSYQKIYDLKNLHTLIRTTLRYPDYNNAWQYVVDLDLTSEKDNFDTNKITHLQWLQEKLQVDDVPTFLKTLCESDITSFQLLEYLLLDNENKIIGLNITNSATILQSILEAKWMMQADDKDMIVMQHEFEYTLENALHYLNSSLIVKGQNKTFTAMAKTVGLPMAILAKNIITGKVKPIPGVQIPVTPSVYEPVLKELHELGIVFEEKETKL